MPQSKYGGIPVEDEAPARSKYGGIPVDESSGQRGSGSGRPQPVAPQDNPPADYGLSKWLPSGRSVMQGGGAAIGGLVGSGGGPLGTIGGGALGGAAGEAAYQLGQRLRGKSNDAATSGEAAKEVGIAGLGGAAQEGVGELLPWLGRSGASRLYRTALKPSTRFATEEAQGITDTLLKNRIPISDSGMRKLNTGISGLNTKIDSEIASNPAAEVSPSAVAKRIDPTIQDFKYKDLHRDLAAAEAEKARFVGEHSTPVQYSPYGHTQISTLPPEYRFSEPSAPLNARAIKPPSTSDAALAPYRAPAKIEQPELAPYTNLPVSETAQGAPRAIRAPELGPYSSPTRPPIQSYQRDVPIPATRAQAMKKAIWQELAPNDFGTVAEGYKQARKAEGMGLKEQLEGLFPRIQHLNAQEGKLLEARPELNRAINRTENRDVLGIGAPIASGAVGALTGSKGLSIAAALAKNAGSRTAILTDILSHPVAGVTPAALPRFGVPPALRRIAGLAGSANQ